MNLTLFKNFPITSYANQLYVNSEKNRNNMFMAWEHDTFTELSSCDKSKKTIRLDMNYYHGNMYNYGILHEENKDYYIFITETEWLSNRTVVLHYEYDWFQTYVYQMDFKKSMVEREHVSDDSLYKYLVDESLPISTYKRLTKTEYKISDFLVVLSVGDTSIIKYDYGIGLENVPCVTKLNDREYSNCLITGDYTTITKAINWFVDDGKLDSIVGVYLIPNKGVSTTSAVLTTDDAEKHGGIERYSDFSVITGVSSSVSGMSVVKPSSIDGYTPKNNKCFNSPYVICQLSNLNGSTVQIPFELSNGVINVSMYFPVTQGSTPVAYPTDFNGLSENLEYCVSGLPTVQIPWNSDTFASYMAQNINSITNNYNEMQRNREYAHVNNAVNTAMGLTNAFMTDSVMGGIGSAVNGIMSGIGTELNYNNQKARLDNSLKDTQSKGDLVHGVFNGTAPYLTDNYTFMLSVLSVNRQNIQMIDDYFTMYGYRVNDIHVPKLDSRLHWNFIKTGGLNVTGKCPLIAIDTVKNMFDNGCTLWHDLVSMYNYDLPNTIK